MRDVNLYGFRLTKINFFNWVSSVDLLISLKIDARILHASRLLFWEYSQEAWVLRFAFVF